MIKKYERIEKGDIGNLGKTCLRCIKGINLLYRCKYISMGMKDYSKEVINSERVQGLNDKGYTSREIEK